MTHYHGNIDDFGMSSVSLAGPLEAKLKAVQEAGFTQLMLTASDLVRHIGGLDGAVAQVQASGLTVTGCQALHDFEGWSGRSHDYKVEMAKSMLEMCQALGCRLLLARSSTSKVTSADRNALIRDLRQLAMLAIPMNISIAYQADAGGHCVQEFTQAWDLVCQADMPNLGLGLDALEALKVENWPDELDLIDPEKLFLVQVADAMGSVEQDFRVFPGEGVHSQALAALVTHLHQLGYRGAYNFDVSNDDNQQLPLPSVALRARCAAVWLGEDVLQRSVPLPNQIRLKRSLAH
jgi:sugar phosphate isomerase/epimerase